MFVVVGMGAVSSLLRHVSVMTSEALARTGTRGQAAGPEGEGGLKARHDGAWVSMVLTSIPHRRCTPQKNRRIPTIPTGCFDGGIVHVSAVDTGPRRSEPVGLTAESGISATGPPPSPARCLRRGPEAMVRRRLRPESARVGLLHEGRDLLTEGCAYCTKAPPTRSTPNPRPVAPHPRAVHPDDAGRHHSDRAGPLRQAQAAALPSGRPAPPVS